MSITNRNECRGGIPGGAETVIVPQRQKKIAFNHVFIGNEGASGRARTQAGRPMRSVAAEGDVLLYGTVVVPGRWSPEAGGAKEALPGRSGRPIWADCRGNAAGAELSVTMHSLTLTTSNFETLLSSLKN